MLSLFKVFMAPNVSEVLDPILQSGFVTQGKQVEAFEKALQTEFNYPYILTVNSATSGLTIALRMLNLSPGDEVITTALTCTATNWPILATGLKIKWADVDPKTCNISIESIKAMITEKTKAIVVVHWGGYPVDLNGLQEVQEYCHHLYGFTPRIIEDCAHAFGAKYKGKFVGTTGNTAVFSLQAIKHLTCGDGGLMFLPSKAEYDRAKLLRWYGIDRERRSGGDFRLEPDIAEWGYKHHMNDISATIGLANLPHIAGNLRRLRENAAMYRARLGNVPGIELMVEDLRDESAYWLFTIKVPNKNAFIQFAKDRGIMASQVHNRNDNHSCVAEFKSLLPMVDKLEKSIVCIPAGWWLTDEEKERVLTTVIEWAEMHKLDIVDLCISSHVTQPVEQQQATCDELLALISSATGHDHKLTLTEFNKRLVEMNRTGGIVIGTVNGKLVGTGRLLIETKFGDPIAHIESIAVDANYRHHGFAIQIVNALVSRAKHAGVYKIVLDCSRELVGLYEKCGFVREAEQMVIRLV